MQLIMEAIGPFSDLPASFSMCARACLWGGFRAGVSNTRLEVLRFFGYHLRKNLSL